MNSILIVIENIIKYTGLLVIIVGFCHVMLQLIGCAITHHHTHGKNKIKNIRAYFGGYILLGLDFIIAADIVSTLVDREFSHLLELIVVVGVRIAISYFLEKEIAEIE